MPDPIASTPPHPEAKAALICDHAIREEGTGKVSLIGIFENIRAPSFPMTHPSLSVYVQATDGQGRYVLLFELVRLDDLVVIGRRAATVEMRDRLAPTEIVFNLQFLQFERPGRYEFRLSANGRYLTNKAFRVLTLEEAQGDGN